MSERFANQSAMISEDALKTPVYIIGAGSIGSFVALTLAKMGFPDITVQDMDTVEEHNIPAQFYPEDSVGQSKVDALKSMVKAFAGVDLKVEGEPWDIHSRLPPNIGLLVVAVDNMDLRKDIYTQWGHRVPYYIEARMGAEVARVYAIKTDVEHERCFYAGTLYPQSEAGPERCAYKTIIYTVLGCASIMAGIAKRIVMAQSFPSEVVYDFVTHTQTSYKSVPLEIPKALETASV